MQEPLLVPDHKSSENPTRKATAVGEEKSDLDRIVEYASVKPPLTRRDMFIYGSIAFLTSASPVSYLRPAYQDEPFALPNTSALKWNQVAATWVPTTYLFYSAGIAFLQIRAANIIPEELNDILAGISKEQIRRQDWGIGMISVLSAIPLTTPLVKYPLIATGKPGYDITGNMALIIVILISNSLAHLRPLQVIVMDPWYGAPFTIYNWIKKKFDDRRLSVDGRSEKRAAEQKIAATARQKAKLIGTLTAKKELLLDSCFVRIPQYKGLLGYTIELSEDFNRISALEDGSFVTELMAYGQTSPVSSSQGLKQKAYEFFLEAVGQMGAYLVLAESMGYLSNAGFTLSKMTGSDAVGWSLAAVPVWAFSVLMHMVGRDSFRGNVDFLIGYVLGEKSLSWPIKYCSKIYFYLCVLPNLDLAYMTAGSGNTMIRGDLEDYWGEETTEAYIGVSRWAFVALTVFLMPAMESYLFTRWAKYFGTEAAKKIVEFDERVERVNTLLLKWKNDHFEEQAPPSLFSESSSSRSLLVNTPSTVQQPRRSWCEWFRFRSSQSEEDAVEAEDFFSPTTTHS